MTPASLLVETLKKRAVRSGVDIKLASGTRANVYVDCKLATLHGPSLEIIGRALWERVKDLSNNGKNIFVAGVSVGGDPLVASVLLAAQSEGCELEGLLIRKEPKGHGASSGKAVDGFPPRQGFDVLLLEDVITTGSSAKKAAEFLKAEGYRLTSVIALVDREVGGVESLRDDLGIYVETLTKLKDLL